MRSKGFAGQKFIAAKVFTLTQTSHNEDGNWINQTMRDIPVGIAVDVKRFNRAVRAGGESLDVVVIVIREKRKAKQ